MGEKMSEFNLIRMLRSQVKLFSISFLFGFIFFIYLRLSEPLVYKLSDNLVLSEQIQLRDEWILEPYFLSKTNTPTFTKCTYFTIHPQPTKPLPPHYKIYSKKMCQTTDLRTGFYTTTQVRDLIIANIFIAISNLTHCSEIRPVNNIRISSTNANSLKVVIYSPNYFIAKQCLEEIRYFYFLNEERVRLLVIDNLLFINESRSDLIRSRSFTLKAENIPESSFHYRQSMAALRLSLGNLNLSSNKHMSNSSELNFASANLPTLSIFLQGISFGLFLGLLSLILSRSVFGFSI